MVAAPILIRLDVPPLAAYMFVFFYGISADITPPVSLASYAASGIAKSDPMVTSVVGFKLALAGYLIPFVYVFNPMLLFIDPEPIMMTYSIATAILGIVLLSMCTIGYYKVKIMWPLRIVAFMGSFSLLHQGFVSDAIGLGVLISLHFIQTWLSKRAQNRLAV
jgi:TRAP-type uncharacterized transport system fused permease subunit